MAAPKITVKGQKLTIEVDLSVEGEPSKSGKSMVISTTSGNIAVETDDGPVTVGLNIYRKK
ncbi:MAG: hypothetical protein KKB59_10350 [Spirochaetes bacterium]|nr:hypothetical protein [Spirochaetota bacterium]